MKLYCFLITRVINLALGTYCMTVNRNICVGLKDSKNVCAQCHIAERTFRDAILCGLGWDVRGTCDGYYAKSPMRANVYFIASHSLGGINARDETYLFLLSPSLTMLMRGVFF